MCSNIKTVCRLGESSLYHLLNQNNLGHIGREFVLSCHLIINRSQTGHAVIMHLVKYGKLSGPMIIQLSYAQLSECSLQCSNFGKVYNSVILAKYLAENLQLKSCQHSYWKPSTKSSWSWTKSLWVFMWVLSVCYCSWKTGILIYACLIAYKC